MDKADQKPIDEETLAKTDEVAEETGFPSREALEDAVIAESTGEEEGLRRKRKSKPKGQLNVQGPKDVLEKFIAYCDEADLSYWEGIEQLLKKVRR
tara:strand:+ start:825 stop:1112 length:288 start_codon:yes stop_codon:yes gene_type:complete